MYNSQAAKSLRRGMKKLDKAYIDRSNAPHNIFNNHGEINYERGSTFQNNIYPAATTRPSKRQKKDDSSSDDPLTAAQDQRVGRDLDKDEEEREDGRGILSSGKRGSGRAEPNREIEGSDFEEDRDSQEVDKDSFEADRDNSGEFQPQGNDDANEQYGSEEDNNAEINDESLVIPATFKDELDKQYRAMKNQHKLLLPSSKRYAEDIMYQYSKAADAETAFKSLCGHWILDLDWAAKSKAFRDTELEDLSKIAVDALPDLPEGYDYIFDCFDTEDIKESEISLGKLATDQLHLDESSQEHSRSTASGMDQATRYWLIHALTGWFCLEKQRSTSDRTEAWWTNNVWASVFDRLMQTMDDVVVLRGETVSPSMTLRKNENRDYASKGGYLWGRRTDARVVLDGRWEYAVTQAAKSLANGPVDTNYCLDYWKLARNLKDMIWALQHWRGAKIAQIGVQIIGLLEQGPEWHIFGMQQHRYTSCIKKHASLRLSMRKDAIGDFLEVLKWSVRIHRFIKELHPWIGRRLKEKNLSHDTTFSGMFANQNSPKGKRLVKSAGIRKDRTARDIGGQ
ncbi:hypothetical protein BDR22DRAFT_976635 [Usnea florida]